MYAIKKPVWEAIYKWDAWQLSHAEPRLVLGKSVKEKLRTMKVNIPVMVLTGDADLHRQNELLPLIPGAKQVAIKGAGHMSNLENPEGFTKSLVSFLNNKF